MKNQRNPFGYPLILLIILSALAIILWGQLSPAQDPAAWVLDLAAEAAAEDLATEAPRIDRAAQVTSALADGSTVLVARIHDGDTFADRAGQSYRLHGVDAPELCQPWGPRARLELADILARGEVRAWAWGGRSWKREVVDVMVLQPHGLSVDVGAELVRRGVAHVDERYVSGPRERALMSIEAAARLRQEGLWRYPPTVRPRDWRADHRGVRPPRCGQ